MIINKSYWWLITFTIVIFIIYVNAQWDGVPYRRHGLYGQSFYGYNAYNPYDYGRQSSSRVKSGNRFFNLFKKFVG